MGGLYLDAEGQKRSEVARAVRWHYHPLSIDEVAPPKGILAEGPARVFGAVSLADKLDTLAGYFGLGLVPSGSSDPYGLRRAAQGAVRVLLDFWSVAAGAKRPSLARLVDDAVAGHGGQLKRPAADVTSDLRAFLIDRLEYVLLSRGFPAEEVAAVVQTPQADPLEDPHDSLVRLQALHRVRAEAREDFEHLAIAFKRAKNILDDQKPGQVNPRLFEAEAERALAEALAQAGRSVEIRRSESHSPDIVIRSKDEDYVIELKMLAKLRAPVDRFFDDVLVMAEDEKVRANRLGLLQQTVSLFYKIADISKLGGSS
jgi:glycyl-tRNA synthetase beta chain